MVDISYAQLFLICILLIPIIIVFKALEIKQTKNLMISIARMFIQLSLVGIYLKYIFQLDSAFVNVGYATIMVIVATFSCIKSIDMSLKVFWIIFFSIWVAVLGVTYFFLGVILDETGFSAQYFVPISGMALGNALKSNIISLNRLLWVLREERGKYEYAIALGATRWEALKPHIKETLMASTKPTIASIATIGLVSLPGMMTGQILGGSFPTVAIKYQIAVMILILSSDFYSVFLNIYMGVKVFFDGYDRPKSKYFK